MHIPFCLLNVSTFPDIMKFFWFLWLVQKKWVSFKIQGGKPLASKSLGPFPIEFCSKHIQWGFQSHNRQLVKHERGYQWRQQNGTNEVVLVTLLLNWRKKYTFSPFYVWISEFRMGGYFLKTCFLNKQFKKFSEGTVLNFHGTRHRVTPDIWPTWLKILLKNLPLFDWRYINSCQIGIKQLSVCVILNLGYHLNDSRMKWYRRSVNPNPILFYSKINFRLLIFQRWTA